MKSPRQKLTAKQKHDKRMRVRMQRLEDQERQLEDEADEIDQEFQALFAAGEKEGQAHAGFNDVGHLQFTEVEEEGLSSEELEAAALQLEENSEDEHERQMLMQQVKQNRHTYNHYD